MNEAVPDVVQTPTEQSEEFYPRTEDLNPVNQVTRNQNIELYLSGKYDFRLNTIKCRIEWRERGKDIWTQADKYFINSLKRELDSIKINTSTGNIKEILSSSFAPRVDPIRSYFSELQKWTKAKYHIKKLCDTVTVQNPGMWYTYFTKWITAVVANALTDTGCQNHTCLVLVGEQGKFKTTWLNNLCPKALSRYLYTGKINIDSKDYNETLLAEYLLINIDDQLRSINKNNEDHIKNIITQPLVKYRRPYDEFINEYPRIASFMGSVNHTEFLSDPTGSRRFLAFEVRDIDIKTAQEIDMDLVWAQAYHLFRSGAKYWFNFEEIQELNRENEMFRIKTIEEELIMSKFKVPASRDSADERLTTTEILIYLESFTKTKLSKKKIGEALARIGYERKQHYIGDQYKWVYAIDKVSELTGS